MDEPSQSVLLWRYSDGSGSGCVAVGSADDINALAGILRLHGDGMREFKVQHAVPLAPQNLAIFGG